MPLQIFNAFEHESSKMSTRLGATMTCKEKKTTMLSFFRRSAPLWSILPGDIKQIENRTNFKQKMRV